tara:strand:- start:1461 stop:1700 length:240 start_codon:yes stop_codon:yes gene_type:complete
MKTLEKGLIIGILSMTLLGVFIFSFSLEISKIDALYFVVTILTTVGFGDYNLQQASQIIKLFGILMMRNCSICLTKALW